MANEFVGNLQVNSVNNAHIRTDANIERTKMAERALTLHAIDLLDLRVHDSVDARLPSSGTLLSGSTEGPTFSSSFPWDPNSADVSFWVAPFACRVLAAVARVEVAGTDGGAVTGALKKAASGTDIAAGTALTTATFDLKGTVDTNQTLTVSATSSALDIATGNAIGVDVTGTLTNARGVVTVTLARSQSDDDLLLVTGTFGSTGNRVKTGDVKTLGLKTRRARFFAFVPPHYDSDGTGDLQLR